MAAELDPSAPLCCCGIRGCEFADLHRAAFVTAEPLWRRVRAGKRRKKHGR